MPWFWQKPKPALSTPVQRPAPPPMAAPQLPASPVVALEIEGLRGFTAEERLPIAVPNGQPGSGLTILVGPNNAGKSSVIEACTAFLHDEPPEFAQPRRNTQHDGIRIRAETVAGGWQELRTATLSPSQAHWVYAPSGPPTHRLPSMLVVPLLRSLDTLFGNITPIDRAQYIDRQRPLLRSGNIMSMRHLFVDRLWQAEQHRDEFNKVLERVIDPVPDWRIVLQDQYQGQYYLEFRSQGHWHPSEGIGEGLVNLWWIIDAVYDSHSTDMIVIDEPERSLHPAVQRKLSKLLVEYAQDRQIIYATHSPYLIDWPSIFNGAQLVRVHKHNGRTRVSSLSPTAVAGLRGLLKDLNFPHTLGLDAREVCFLDDQVLLVEGQEDAVFYPRVAQQLSRELPGTVFGWGVGGAGKMQHVARMLSDLGFERVVGLLDNDQLKQQAKLKQYFPQYTWLTIPARDVRSKPARPAADPVAGLLDFEGVLRPEHRQPLLDLFDQMTTALSGRPV